ncbi:sulfite exporter TauE/SafE family protein [Geotoga petraea]|uniref:Probable membrane transporter protein n=1 Tax=Geotoga petraea TaxID=28234 RepID=A0A1G6NRK9_9BACT|nr:sulfite exporter TauE/SafE family protein [Geotoga petraea]TGG87795.1 sulfite exporter TauE/SafE family protein [Geotoga petraea]SDC69805.1 hypothetical protein SAMN04488588_1617 [Geotoga petraea]
MLYFFVFLGGILSGFINVNAGGGSLITLPLLNFLGLPLDVANGTNRIGILFQNVTSVSKFKKEKVLDFKRALFLAIPTTIGAILGSNLVVEIDKDMLKPIVGIILLIMSVFIIWKPKVWVEQKDVKANNFVSFIVFFAIGIYGGFLQAGVGFFFIIALVMLEGYDLLKTNAIKVFLVMVYTAFSLLIFALNGKVDLIAGLFLAAGSSLGAYFGSKFAIKRGSNWIRFIVFAMVIISAIVYLVQSFT